MPVFELVVTVRIDKGTEVIFTSEPMSEGYADLVLRHFILGGPFEVVSARKVLAKTVPTQ